jgi:hypothetical protein
MAVVGAPREQAVPASGRSQPRSIRRNLNVRYVVSTTAFWGQVINFWQGDGAAFANKALPKLAGPKDAIDISQELLGLIPVFQD